jgi:hypothetical protein
MITAIDAVEGDGNVYIGSTTKKYLSQRMEAHRHNFEGWIIGSRNYTKISSFILFEKFGIDNCKMVLLELCNVSSKDELHACERKHIVSTACVNKDVPGRTQAEYREDHIEELRVKGIEHYNLNKESINLKRRECETVVCECGNSVTRLALINHRKTKKHISALAQLDSVYPTDSV